MARAFEDLVAAAEAVSVDGWDFSWLDGRASEERPSWGYARMMGERMAAAAAALDIQTGGGEVLAGVRRRPVLTVATESWPPNLARATRRLHPLGVTVVVHDAEQPLPFGASAFDLVVCRHPVGVWWEEIARVLRPGGTYFSQEVGPDSVGELTDFFMGPRAPGASPRQPELARAAAEAAGLVVTDLGLGSMGIGLGAAGIVLHSAVDVVGNSVRTSVGAGQVALIALIWIVIGVINVTYTRRR